MRHVGAGPQPDQASDDSLTVLMRAEARNTQLSHSPSPFHRKQDLTNVCCSEQPRFGTSCHLAPADSYRQPQGPEHRPDPNGSKTTRMFKKTSVWTLLLFLGQWGAFPLHP